jgi:hypothetical protein
VAGMFFGFTSRFAIHLLDSHRHNEPALCRIEAWAAHRCLTADEHYAYLPSLIGDLQWTIASLQCHPRAASIARPFLELSAAENHRRLAADAAVGDNRDYLAYRFLQGEPTGDNVVMHLFREGGIAYLPFSFCRDDHQPASELGQVFVAELLDWELARVLHDAAWTLVWRWADRNKHS